jgi:hypothetical protein
MGFLSFFWWTVLDLNAIYLLAILFTLLTHTTLSTYLSFAFYNLLELLVHISSIVSASDSLCFVALRCPFPPSPLHPH